jgi:hypothetical protein
VRVTDGSASANPVTGVNVVFNTTLARVGSGGGQPFGGDDSAAGSAANHFKADDSPVILDSSQAQVMTGQGGLASIVPSVGNVGPCDVFISVTAGASTIQLQMESVSAIVAQNPIEIPIKVQPPRPVPYRALHSIAAQSAPDVLFAVPEGLSGEVAAVQDAPIDDVTGKVVRGDASTDSPEKACPLLSGDNAVGNRDGAAPQQTPPETGNASTRPCLEPRPAENQDGKGNSNSDVKKAPKKSAPDGTVIPPYSKADNSPGVAP